MENIPSTKVENPNLKLPAFITKQVFTGFLNDIFSTCVLKNTPKDTALCIELETRSLSKKSKPYYMLALKWSKTGINIEAISHGFSVVKRNPEGETALEEPICRGAELAIGLATAMQIKGDVISASSHISASIFDGYVSAEICKKGLWAYMSMPKLLSDAKNTDNKDELTKVKLRRSKIRKIAERPFHVIDSAIIVPILWCIHRLKFTESYKDLSKILFDEFMAQKNEIKTIIPFLLLANDMHIISAKEALEIITVRLDKLPLAQLLGPRDMIGIITIFQREGYIYTDLTKRIIILLVEIIPTLSAELCVTLLWGLARSNYDFKRDESLKHILLQRIYVVCDSIPLHRSLDMLFNSLALLNVDCTAFCAAAFNKILRLLHILGPTEIINIGCAYAIAAEKFQMLGKKKPNGNSKESFGQENLNAVFLDDNKGLHSCLRRKTLSEFLDYFPWDTILLYTLLPIARTKNSGVLKKFVEMILDHEDACRNGKINPSANLSNPNEIESYLTHAVEEPVAINSQRLFYLNILEDCRNQLETLEFDAVAKILYSLLALNVDITSIYQEMMVVKGDAIRKKGNDTALKMIKSDDIEDKKSQLRMIWSILHYKQKSNEITDPLLLDDAIINVDNIFAGLESELGVITQDDKDVQVHVTEDKDDAASVSVAVQELPKEIEISKELYKVLHNPLISTKAPKSNVDRVTQATGKDNNTELEHLLSVAQNLLETINNIKGAIKSDNSMELCAVRPSDLGEKTAATSGFEAKSTNIEGINDAEGEKSAKLCQQVMTVADATDEHDNKNKNKKYSSVNYDNNVLSDGNGIESSTNAPIFARAGNSDNGIQSKKDATNISQVKCIEYLRDNYIGEARGNDCTSGSFEEIPGCYFKIKRFSTVKIMLVKWNAQT